MKDTYSDLCAPSLVLACSQVATAHCRLFHFLLDHTTLSSTQLFLPPPPLLMIELTSVCVGGGNKVITLNTNQSTQLPIPPFSPAPPPHPPTPLSSPPPPSAQALSPSHPFSLTLRLPLHPNYS